MSNPFSDQNNPYQSPATAGPQIHAGNTAQVALVKVLRDFRSQIVALGAFWIIIGAIATGMGVYLTTQDAQNPNQKILMIVVAVMGGAWIALGALVCAKQIWALYIGLVLSYLSLVGNLVNLNICAIVLVAVVILQAHRVLGWVKQLRAAGIPLSTRPEDLQIQPASPT
jgi:hypothetical protein